ncbi:hypothetical protein [Roseiflexus sp.]
MESFSLPVCEQAVKEVYEFTHHPGERTRVQFPLKNMTSLQKRTAETLGAQRTLKTTHDGCLAQIAWA